jgi:ankyrin repeat protein
MMVRVFGAVAAAALMSAAVPAAAQQFSDSHEFLEAVRDKDGGKVDKFLRDKTLRLVNAKDRNSGDGAIHIVTNRGDQLYLRVIAQQEDVNLNLPDRRGNTALILAAGRGWEEGVTILLRYKANVNLANASGETPLIRAVQIHNAEIVRILLAAGADPDRTDSVTGKSARDYARDSARWPAITKLLTDAPASKGGAAGVSGPKL